MMERGRTAVDNGEDAPEPFSLRGHLRDLYFGSDRRATRFQAAHQDKSNPAGESLSPIRRSALCLDAHYFICRCHKCGR